MNKDKEQRVQKPKKLKSNIQQENYALKLIIFYFLAYNMYIKQMIKINKVLHFYGKQSFHMMMTVYVCSRLMRSFIRFAHSVEINKYEQFDCTGRQNPKSP